MRLAEVRANEDKPYSWSPDNILIKFGVLLSAVTRYSAEFRKLYFFKGKHVYIPLKSPKFINKFSKYL